MSADPPLRVALVGCGAIARAHARALEHTADILEPVALMDIDATALERMCRETGLPGHASLTALMEQEEPDAALVLTPPSSHEPIVCELLRSGVHVLCEKPLATAPELALGMVGTARKADRVLMMGSKYRYAEDLIEARGILREGRVGEVLLFEILFSTLVDMSARWNAVPAISGGGVLMDNGCHCAEIARFLLGPVTRVRARLEHREGLEVEDTAQVLLEVLGGAIGSVELSWTGHREARAYLRVYGSEGTLEIGWTGSRYYREGDAGWTDFGSGYDKLTAMQRQLRNFAGSIRGSEVPMITADDALASVKVIDAAYRSATGQTWTEVS